MADRNAHADHGGHSSSAMDNQRDEQQPHGQHAHAGHGVDHSVHEIMFCNRFWICLLSTITFPVASASHACAMKTLPQTEIHTSLQPS